MRRRAWRGAVAGAALGAVASCAPAGAREVPAIEVRGAEWAFQMPSTIAPGRQRVAFTNAGTVAHEVAVGLVKAGVSLDSVLAAELRGDPDIEEKAYESGAGLLWADAGDVVPQRLVLEFKPGRSYVFLCTLSDSTGTSHAQRGMLRGVTIPVAAR